MSGKDQIGAKLGPRVARLVADAIVDVQRRSMPTKHKLVMHSFEAMSDQISGEVNIALRPVLRKLLDQSDLPDEIRPWLEFLHDGHGQLKALAGSSLAQASILTPVAEIITNTLNPYVYKVIESNPTSIPDPGTIASIVASGADTDQGTRWAMHAQGMNDSWVNDLYEAAYTYPSVAQVYDAFNRGLASEQEAVKWLRRNGLPQSTVDTIMALRVTLLSPPDAALAVLRGNMSSGDGYKIAASNGVSSADFDILIGNTGEPPGLEQMLEGYRRNFIDRATLEKGIRQSRVRDEWIPFVEKLRYAPMSTADAVNGVVQGHLTQAQASGIAEQNGLEPGQVDTLIANAGAPLAHEQLAELYNRGEITLGEFEQGIRESRLKDKYIQGAVQLGVKTPPPREVTTWLKDGAITKADALRYIKAYGYDDTAAHAVLDAGTAQKVSAAKHLASGTVTALYEDKAIDRAKAVQLLGLLKYDEQEASFLLELADLKAEQKIVSQGVASIRSKYVARHFDEGQASVLLDQLGVPSAQRDLYLKLWGIERNANVKTLSEAQVAKALKLQLITTDDAMTRLEAMGYSEEDAALLVAGA